MSSVKQLIDNISTQIIAPIVLLLFALAFTVFFWGLADFIRGGDNEEAKKNGREHMLWGIVGIFIMVGAWGIILIVLNTFGIEKPLLPGIF